MPIIRSFGLDRPTIPEVRTAFPAAAAELPLPEGVAFKHRALSDMPCLLVRRQETVPMQRVLYLHGGGFVFGTIESQKGMACRLAVATGLEIVLVEYRLAPEHPCPAATDDAVAA